MRTLRSHAILAGFLAAALAVGMPVPLYAQDQKDNAGELAFNGTCGTCHVLRPDDNRLGPTLNGVIGRKAGSVASYGNYSTSMKSANIVWDAATLDKFMENPEAVVPGNNMKPYAGTSDADARAKIIGFLTACNTCGPECPAPKKCKPGDKTE